LNGAVSLTKVALSNPARVCPKRIDNSSVAKARSYTSVSSSHTAKDRRIHTLARGTMARNETIDSLDGE
jgi:predicted nucleotidyltransferase